jgi:hypothetical protein
MTPDEKEMQEEKLRLMTVALAAAFLFGVAALALLSRIAGLLEGIQSMLGIVSAP